MGKKHKKYGAGGGPGMGSGAHPQYGMPPYGAPNPTAGTGGWPYMGADPSAMAGAAPGGMADGMAAGYGSAAGYGPAYEAGPFDAGLLQGLPAFLRSRQTEQFLLGALVGAAAAWVLSDEEMRGKLVKAGMQLYAGVVGGFEEMKEQMADIKAEVEAERHGEA